jgi:hypothetical protein
VAIFLGYVIGAEHSEMAVLCCGWVMVLNFRGCNARYGPPWPVTQKLRSKEAGRDVCGQMRAPLE